jgi:hypothetical protein
VFEDKELSDQATRAVEKTIHSDMNDEQMTKTATEVEQVEVTNKEA